MKKTTYELLQWGLRLEKEVRDFEEYLSGGPLKELEGDILNTSTILKKLNVELKKKMMKPEQ